MLFIYNSPSISLNFHVHFSPTSGVNKVIPPCLIESIVYLRVFPHSSSSVFAEKIEVRELKVIDE